MNRKLIVTLLQKDIRELEMITQGFMEMSEYPKAIIALAQRKTEDIQEYIYQLASDHPNSLYSEDESVNTASMATCAASCESKPDETVENVETKGVEVAEDSEVTEVMEVMEDTEILEILDDVDDVENIDEVIEEDEEIDDFDIENIEEEEEKEEEEIVEDEMVFDIDTTDEEEEPTVINESANLATEETLSQELSPSEAETADNENTKSENEATTIAEKVTAQTTTRNDALSGSQNSLGATLANSKISDIKQAISIGERFRFQRELFRGNGEDMNKTLNYLNQLATAEEAMAFLKSKYGWISENQTAEEFYQIVSRRFL